MYDAEMIRYAPFAMLLLLTAFAAPSLHAQLSDPLRPPAIDGKPPAGSLPAAAPDHARLLEQLHKRLAKPPAANADPTRVKQRLDEIIVDATTLAGAAAGGPLEMSARSIQLQAIHLRVSRWPAEPQSEALLFQMEASAEAFAQLDQPNAGAIGDFWLLNARLAQLNRQPLSPAERHKRVRQQLDDFVLKYPSSPPTGAVKQMLAQLPAERGARPATPANTAAPTPGAPAAPAANANVPAIPGAGPGPGAPIDEAFELGPREREASGIVRYPIRSRYQATTNVLRVLEPRPLPPPHQRKLLFVLPVEAGEGKQWGDPLTQIRELDLHNKHGLIVVMPTFSALPWYADHPTDPALRQERYMARAVVPAIEKLYEPEQPQRLLVGFSKSGFGALSLLLRYPDMFTAAAAWDAPLMKESPDNYGMGPIFGTQENFDRYRLDRQVREKSRIFSRQSRIALLGYDHFREDMQRAHNLLEQLGIPHEWRDGPHREHHWESGWLQEAIETVVKLGAPE